MSSHKMGVVGPAVRARDAEEFDEALRANGLSEDVQPVRSRCP